jgi:hypothetical protein
MGVRRDLGRQEGDVLRSALLAEDVGGETGALTEMDGNGLCRSRAKVVCPFPPCRPDEREER